MNQHGENGKKGKLRNYTNEQKQEAVEDALEIGNTASARMHGIPLTTLSGWVKAAKKAFATHDQENEKHSVRAFEFQPHKSKERKAARRYTPSQKAQMLEYSSDHGIAATHRKYDVSRFSLYDWRKKRISTRRHLLMRLRYPKVHSDNGSAQYKKTPPKTRRWNLSPDNKTLIAKNSILPHENNPRHK